MRIARILYPVTVLGPGKRIVIWVAGCNKRCKGCANPELWNMDDYPDMPMEDLINALEMLYDRANGKVDGVTISGGEPFLQSEELEKLVRFLKGKTKDIIVFSGYPIGELSKNIYSAAVLKEITVLVDGEYDEKKNIGDVLRGSINQKIHFLGEGVDDKFVETYTKYQQIYNGKYATENFRVNDGVISVGIHKKDFKQQLEETLKEKDIVKIKNNEEKR